MNEPQADHCRVLIVDDDDSAIEAEWSSLESRNVEASVVHPNDLTKAQLLDADLVLVDYRLDSWAARDSPALPISLRPQTGVSLAALLREHIGSKETPTLVALRTAHLDDIRGPRLPPGVSRHVVASVHGLEWIFEESDPSGLDQMAMLADAARRIPNPWPAYHHHAAELVKQLLGMDAAETSFDRCWRRVMGCQAPLGSLMSDGGGIRFLRWLLHRILPYPTFLIDEHWVAARLAISVGDLQRVVDAGRSRLARDLQSISYSGVLAGFLGNRWWGGKLEDYIWELLQEVGDNRHRLREELSKRAGEQLSDTVPGPVVVLDPATFQPRIGFASVSGVVRVRPEYWPDFADPAFLEIEAVEEDPSLRAMVDPLDVGRLKGECDDQEGYGTGSGTQIPRC